MSPLTFSGISVYRHDGCWRVAYAGTILRLEDSRAKAEACGAVYSQFFGVPMRVFTK